MFNVCFEQNGKMLSVTSFPAALNSATAFSPCSFVISVYFFDMLK